MGPHYPHSTTLRATGFTLIEIVVVMLIFGIVIAMAAAITRGVTASQKRSLTATRLATVDAALVQFVSQQKRLPCPADGSLVSSHVNAGVEMRAAIPAPGACTGNQQNGVVPWRSLGLSENDATDGWDRRLTYRLDPTLGSDNGLNMSWCDPAGTEPAAVPPPNACNTGCTSATMVACTPPALFLNTRGLEVRSVAGVVLMNPAAPPYTGAAYVVISPGESGGGGYLNSGQLGVSTVGDGTEEMKNYASLPYAPVATYYVDDSLAEAAGANHYDDVVLRPTILSVASKAGLGPRAH